MTTIAYRDGVLAADGRTQLGSAIFSDESVKIHRLSDGALFALAGAEAFIGPMLDALEDGEDLPIVDPDDDNTSFTAVILEKSGKLRLYEGVGNWMTLDVPYVAFGSGADFAMGAMEMGASAEEAVQVACRRDVNSGGRILVVKPGYVDPVPEE